jgi:hypothetical protein
MCLLTMLLFCFTGLMLTDFYLFLLILTFLTSLNNIKKYIYFPETDILRTRQLTLAAQTLQLQYISTLNSAFIFI